MAYTCRLIEGTETPIVLYAEDPGYGLLDQGLQPNDPQVKEVWGGFLESELVRYDEGKRLIPLKLDLKGSSDNDLIDRVNAFERRLRHARRFHIDGWGDEVFLDFKLDLATHNVLFPVITGAIDKTRLMSKCAVGDSRIIDLPVLLVCEPYWEDDATFTLENYIDNPGFWRGATAPGDSWTEVDPAAALTLAWNTTIWEVMGRSLQWTIAPDGVNDVGITSDPQTVVASTAYYWEIRGYHTAGCDDIRAAIWDVTGAPAEIVAARLIFNNQDDAWEKLGVGFTTPAGCTSIEVRVRRMLGDSSVGDKIFYCDAIYLQPRADAPPGWCSSRNLSNHLDDGADHLNVLCVTEIPGEVAAECQFDLVPGGDLSILHAGKRTRNDPHDFIWQLVPCAAYTFAEGGAGGACTPALIDNTNCFDSDKINDPTSPSGSNITVTFATQKAMMLRCYWRIMGTALASYQGKYNLIVLAKNDAVGAITDTIQINLRAYGDLPHDATHYQINPIPQTCKLELAGDWTVHDGWIIFSYPIGEMLELWDTGNSWDIQLYASTDAPGAPTDKLLIAGAYLVPIDEEYCIAGYGQGTIATPTDPDIVYLSNLDRHNGIFVYDPSLAIYTADFGYVGRIPHLEPQIENWLYFVFQLNDTVDIDEGMRVSLAYRPRGIFLRGTNP